MELIEMQLRSIAELPREEIRGAIGALQQRLLDAPESTTDLACFPVRHVFAPGCYAREMTIPEGQLIIGRIHKHAHVNIISKGKCKVLTEFGFETLEAPCTFVSLPGTKRVVVALDTVVWTTIHPTTLTDPEAIVQECTVEYYDEIEIDGELLENTP